MTKSLDTVPPFMENAIEPWAERGCSAHSWAPMKMGEIGK